MSALDEGIALLAELEQAERDAAIDAERLAKLSGLLAQAERELTAARIAKAKAQRECGQWKFDALAWKEKYQRLSPVSSEAEAQLAAVPALVEALREIEKNAGAWHGPPPDDSGHVRALAVIGRWSRDALAKWEQAQGEKP